VRYRYDLGLFEAFGVELEYMIVDRRTLDVRPVADELLRAAAGAVEAEVERGALAWSNELALHVVEFKTNGPSRRLDGLARSFQAAAADANALLEPLGARLLPGAMHPWMDPDAELVLWPHEYSPVYGAFDRIFGCHGHGWANVQSAHLNLPFRDDEEFGRLHAAIRLVLPILPGLAASSPIVAGRSTGLLDNRLDFYRRHTARVPSVTAAVVPEPVFSREAYEREILGEIYRDLAAHDPEGTLRHDWVNARGAIARFDRGTIEIRVLDVQECPAADLAIAAAAAAVIEALCCDMWSTQEQQRRLETAPLAGILAETTRSAGDAWIRDSAYLRLLGQEAGGPLRARELWRKLIEATLARRAEYGEWKAALEMLVEEGSLASRLLRRVGPEPTRSQLREAWEDLAGCLLEGRLLHARG
jgi:gamma-glutamyl:cysteine ligase YbdK (ATP-grasp superfamily)